MNRRRSFWTAKAGIDLGNGTVRCGRKKAALFFALERNTPGWYNRGREGIVGATSALIIGRSGGISGEEAEIWIWEQKK